MSEPAHPAQGSAEAPQPRPAVTPLPARPPAYGLACMIAACALMVLNLVVLLVGVPRFAHLLASHAAAPPALTLYVLELAAVLRSLGPVVLPLAGVASAVLVCLPLLVRRRFVRILATVLLAMFAAGAVLTALAFLLPLQAVLGAVA